MTPTERPDEDGPRDSHGDEMGLVMPFVVVTSVGGPFDDAAFVAGMQCGHIDAALEQIAATRQPSSLAAFWMANVYTPLLPQVDLIAMRHGFDMESEPIEGMEDEWTSVTFRIAAGSVGGLG